MQVQRTESVESVQIVADADRLTSRAGPAAACWGGRPARLERALSQAMRGVRRRCSRHDPGQTLRDQAVMRADDGDCLAEASISIALSLSFL